MINGLYILLMIVVAIVYTVLGYQWGKADERKKRDTEMLILNQKLNENYGKEKEK